MTESGSGGIPVTTAFELPGMTVEKPQLTEIVAYGTAVVARPTGT